MWGKSLQTIHLYLSRACQMHLHLQLIKAVNRSQCSPISKCIFTIHTTACVLWKSLYGSAGLDVCTCCWVSRTRCREAWPAACPGCLHKSSALQLLSWWWHSPCHPWYARRWLWQRSRLPLGPGGQPEIKEYKYKNKIKSLHTYYIYTFYFPPPNITFPRTSWLPRKGSGIVHALLGWYFILSASVFFSWRTVSTSEI